VLWLLPAAHLHATPLLLSRSVWVKEGTVRDVVGNANTVRPSLTVKYRPSSSGLQAGAVVANVFFASSLALCTAASYVHSALLPFSHGVLGEGACAEMLRGGGGQGARAVQPPSAVHEGLAWLRSLLLASASRCRSTVEACCARPPTPPPRACKRTRRTGCGALGFVGWAQSLYLTGQLSAAWMPESYRQVADTFSWTVGDIGCAGRLA